ncbi:MAG TPA: hypothetical protein VF236_00860 [Gaiellaceae bacterium]
MPFWRRREKSLHEQLAEGTGLLEWRSRHAPVYPPSFAGTLDVLHGGRPRQWDAVGATEAPGLPGDQLEFAALPDGTLLVDDELPEDALTPIAEVVEQSIAPPYRAQAVRREGDLWAVAANRLEVVELPEEVPGDTVSLAVQDGERTLLVDERPAWESIPTLEAYGAAVHADFVLSAERLDGDLWAVKVNPL